VKRKLNNFAAIDPNNRSKGLSNGSKLDASEVEYFSERLDELVVRASELADPRSTSAGRSVVAAPTPPDSDSGSSGGASAEEVEVRFETHLRRERNDSIVRQKKSEVLQLTGGLACEVCGFDFEKTYGERGRGFAECHHVIPLSVSGATITRLKDLAIVCANCQRMFHVGDPWMTPAELRALVLDRWAQGDG